MLLPVHAGRDVNKFPGFRIGSSAPRPSGTHFRLTRVDAVAIVHERRVKRTDTVGARVHDAEHDGQQFAVAGADENPVAGVEHARQGYPAEDVGCEGSGLSHEKLEDDAPMTPTRPDGERGPPERYGSNRSIPVR